MKTIAIIDLRNLSSYAQASWLDYDNTSAAVCTKLSLCDELYTLGYNNADLLISPEHTIIDIIQQLQALVTDSESWIIYADAAAPFLDVSLLQKMLNTSRQYFVEYHFAEGYPRGFATQILSSSILPQLLTLAQQQPTMSTLKENFFFQLMKSKLNDFDIETELSPIDLRQLRLELLYNNKSNAKICNALIKQGIIDLQALLAHHESLEQLAVGLPAYYNLQISTNCPQRCSYCPYPSLKNFNSNIFSDPAKLHSLLEKIVSFSGEATIGLNLLGEPALHPNLETIITAILSFPTLRLHLETSGIGWSEQALERLKQQSSSRVSIIVSIDSFEISEYTQVRGEGLIKALEFIQFFHNDASWRDRLWVQRVRTTSMEDGLQKFYQQAQAAGYQVIIQQYHTYADKLPKGINLDLSPIKRTGCWALKREMSIYLDGSVHLCRVDINGDHVLGNAYQDDLEIIWQRMQEVHQRHLQQNYPTICQHCEEYYIYTF